MLTAAYIQRQRSRVISTLTATLSAREVLMQRLRQCLYGAGATDALFQR